MKYFKNVLNKMLKRLVTERFFKRVKRSQAVPCSQAYQQICKRLSALSFMALFLMAPPGMAESQSLASADPQLKHLFALALAHNPNIELAQSEVDINGHQLMASQSEEGLSVRFISELSYAWVEENDFGRTASQLRASYPLYQPEKKARSQVSQQAVEIAKQDVKISQQDILLEIAMSYYEYWQQQAEWEFLGKEQQTYQDLLKQTKSRFQLGYQGLNDLTEIQAKIDSLQAQQIAVQQKMQNLYFSLTELINSPFDMSDFTRVGVLPKGLTSLTNLASQPNINLNENDQAWSDLIHHNPAIMAIDKQTRLISKQIEVDRLSDGPQIELFTAYIHNDSNGYFYDDMQGLQGGVQINVPIYLSGKTDAKVAKTRASMQQSEIRKTIMIRKVTRIAQQSQASYELGLQQLVLLNKAVESNKEAITAIENGMSTGNRNMIDLLNAYSDLHKAEKTIPILNAQLWQHWWQFQWATGGLAEARSL